MKIVNLFKQELKTKWSSRLLVGLMVVFVSSVFGSSFLLKREYDLVEKESEGRFKGYKKLVNQSFTHIKTTGGSSGQISVETGNEPVVFVKNRGQNWATMAEKIFVKGDTLFVNLDKQGGNYEYHYPPRHPTITIVAPNIQSISADNSYITVVNWQQKKITVNLDNWSTLETMLPLQIVDSFKISMSNFSRFMLNNYFESHISNKYDKNIIDNKINGPTSILSAEANLKGGCALHLGFANIQNLKLNATEGNKIELSSETLNALMKK